jgi:hypothetical protein
VQKKNTENANNPMPIKHSPTEKAFVQNIKAEIKSGKPSKQAPAYSAQKQATQKQAVAKKR